MTPRSPVASGDFADDSEAQFAFTRGFSSAHCSRILSEVQCYFVSMGHLRRRLSIGSSKSRTQSLNPETGVIDAENAMRSQEVQGTDAIDAEGGDTLPQEVVDPSDGATISSPSAQQSGRPSFLAKLRRRSSSVAPPTLDSPAGSAAAIISDDVVAAATAAERAREGVAGGGDETTPQRGRMSRRSSFSVMAQARAMLGRRSLSRASSREKHSNTNTAGGTVPLDAPPSKPLLEVAPKGTSNGEAAKTNSPYVPPGITITRDPTEDAHEEDAACFSHLPLEKDPLDMQLEHKEEFCMVPVAASPALEKQVEGVEGKEEAAVKRDSNSKDEMALSETSDQLTVGAPSSLVSAEDATKSEDGIQEHQQEEGTSAKAEESGIATVFDKPRRRLRVNSHKKEGRSAGGSTKNDSRKEKGGKALKNGIENRDCAEEKKEEECFGNPGEVTKPVSRWHRRLSISRERRRSTQSRLREEKEEDENGNILDCESVCTADAGKQGYFGRIRRRISISRERRAGRDGSIAGKTDDTGEERRTYTGAGIERTETGNEAEEMERTPDFKGTEGEVVPKKESGWSRLRRSSITSAVSVVRGRSRDARGAAGSQQPKEDNSGQRAQQQDNCSIAGEKQSLAKSLRRRLSRSSLRLPRSNSRESSLGSKGQEGDESLCGNADEGSECVAAGKEKRTWRRRLSDRFRSKSRDPPLPSPKGMPCIGRGAGTEDQKLFSEDVRNSEYASSTLESTNGAQEHLAHTVEEESALQEPDLATEEERSYNRSGHASGGEKQANTKGTLSEELSEPFAVTPETSQTTSEQPSSEDTTPRYPANEYLRGQKIGKRGEKSNARQQQRDQSGNAFPEERYRSETQENERKCLGTSVSRTGAEDFMQWMNQNQEEEAEGGAYKDLQDESQTKDKDQYQSDGECSDKKANAEEKRKKLGIFFCCGNDDNDTAVEKDKWKQALQTRLTEGKEFREQYGYGKDANVNRPIQSPQPVCCKDLFEDPEVGCAYPLCYAPTDCLLELGMAI